jgi:hypothetical protein
MKREWAEVHAYFSIAVQDKSQRDENGHARIYRQPIYFPSQHIKYKSVRDLQFGTIQETAVSYHTRAFERNYQNYLGSYQDDDGDWYSEFNRFWVQENKITGIATGIYAMTPQELQRYDATHTISQYVAGADKNFQKSYLAYNRFMQSSSFSAASEIIHYGAAGVFSLLSGSAQYGAEQGQYWLGNQLTEAAAYIGPEAGYYGNYLVDMPGDALNDVNGWLATSDAARWMSENSGYLSEETVKILREYAPNPYYFLNDNKDILGNMAGGVGLIFGGKIASSAIPAVSKGAAAAAESVAQAVRSGAGAAKQQIGFAAVKVTQSAIAAAEKGAQKAATIGAKLKNSRTVSPRAQMLGQWVNSRINSLKVASVNSKLRALRKPRNANNLAGGPLENAKRVSGRFAKKGEPNSTVYRADDRGNVTSYAVYDSDGLIVKRVDVIGKPHNGVRTPHVVDYIINVDPKTGKAFVGAKDRKNVRRAIPEEIP